MKCSESGTDNDHYQTDDNRYQTDENRYHNIGATTLFTCAKKIVT